MNCQRIQNSLIDFESGALPEAEAAAIREHLKSCPECQRHWAGLHETLLTLDRLPAPAPSPRLRQQFYAMLDAQTEAGGSAHPFRDAPRPFAHWYEFLLPHRAILQAAAAVALLGCGIVLGSRFWPGASKAGDTAAQLDATRQELALLRRQVDSVNQLVTYSLSQQQPAQARLQNVMATLNRGGTDERELAPLLSTLAFDPSTNVRLSALEALYAHADNSTVRQGVRAALNREASPLVQVAMIDFLASVRDRDAAPALQQLSTAPNTDKTVRTAAERALAQI